MLTCIALGLLALLERRWWLAGLLGLLATATSPIALAFVLSCAWCAGWAAWREPEPAPAGGPDPGAPRLPRLHGLALAAYRRARRLAPDRAGRVAQLALPRLPVPRPRHLRPGPSRPDPDRPDPGGRHRGRGDRRRAGHPAAATGPGPHLRPGRGRAGRHRLAGRPASPVPHAGLPARGGLRDAPARARLHRGVAGLGRLAAGHERGSSSPRGPCSLDGRPAHRRSAVTDEPADQPSGGPGILVQRGGWTLAWFAVLTAGLGFWSAWTSWPGAAVLAPLLVVAGVAGMAATWLVADPRAAGAAVGRPRRRRPGRRPPRGRGHSRAPVLHDRLGRLQPAGHPGAPAREGPVRDVDGLGGQPAQPAVALLDLPGRRRPRHPGLLPGRAPSCSRPRPWRSASTTSSPTGRTWSPGWPPASSSSSCCRSACAGWRRWCSWPRPSSARSRGAAPMPCSSRSWWWPSGAGTASVPAGGPESPRWIGPLALGVACSVKQTPWFCLPLLVIGLGLEARRRGEPVWRVPARYLLVVVGVFAACNLPFVIWGPRAWADGLLIPFTKPLVADGQGLVTLAIHGLTGGVVLPLLSVAAALAYVALLAAFVVWYPAMKVVWLFVLPVVLLVPGRSFSSYLIDFFPAALVAAVTVVRVPRTARVDAGTPARRWVARSAVGVPALASAAVCAAGLHLGAPRPVGRRRPHLPGHPAPRCGDRHRAQPDRAPRDPALLGGHRQHAPLGLLDPGEPRGPAGARGRGDGHRHPPPQRVHLVARRTVPTGWSRPTPPRPTPSAPRRCRSGHSGTSAEPHRRRSTPTASRVRRVPGPAPPADLQVGAGSVSPPAPLAEDR